MNQSILAAYTRDFNFRVRFESTEILKTSYALLFQRLTVTCFAYSSN
jgi:hypothetical protein